jgi:hypothetical protein
LAEHGAADVVKALREADHHHASDIQAKLQLLHVFTRAQESEL